MPAISAIPRNVSLKALYMRAMDSAVTSFYAIQKVIRKMVTSVFCSTFSNQQAGHVVPQKNVNEITRH